MSSVNPELGKKVHEHLISLGLETPMTCYTGLSDLSTSDKKHKIESYMSDIMKILGLDISNDSMIDTPKRIAKMYLDEVFYGLNYDHFPKMMTFENSFKNAGMVVEKGIQVNSACSHHFVPTIGTAVIGYIPKDKVIGLSKLNRITNFFARRPQEQERFTMQIHATICYLLETDDVAVYIDASHYCVKWRGVQDHNASMVCSKISAAFLSDNALRQEFYSLAK